MRNNIVGTYNSDGDLSVIVDGKFLRLNKSLAIVNHSPTGFSAGYGGSGPSQLALAILLEVLQDKDEALKYYQDFKIEYISNPSYFNKDFKFSVDIKEWIRRREE